MNHNVLQDECNIRISSGRCLKHHYCLPCHQKKRSKSKFNHAQKVKIIKRMLKISIVYHCLHHFFDARPILIWIYKLENQHFMLIDALFIQKPTGWTLKVFRSLNLGMKEIILGVLRLERNHSISVEAHLVRAMIVEKKYREEILTKLLNKVKNKVG